MNDVDLERKQVEALVLLVENEIDRVDNYVVQGVLETNQAQDIVTELDRIRFALASSLLPKD